MLVAGSVPAEMIKYTDSQGRLHFTQDISQVPPEYRNQVEKQKLGREINVTGEGGGAQGQPARIRAMEERSRRLQRATTQNRPKPAAGPAKPKNVLTGAPEPNKYNRDCYYRNGKRRCTKSLTGKWRAWDKANGGNNGKAVTRRRVGK